MYDFGSYKVNIDIEYHKNEFRNILAESKAKVTGLKGHNLFCSLSKEDKAVLQDYLVDLTGTFMIGTLITFIVENLLVYTLIMRQFRGMIK